jgi:hypothetical protein
MTLHLQFSSPIFNVVSSTSIWHMVVLRFQTGLGGSDSKWEVGLEQQLQANLPIFENVQNNFSRAYFQHPDLAVFADFQTHSAIRSAHKKMALSIRMAKAGAFILDLVVCRAGPCFAPL